MRRSWRGLKKTREAIQEEAGKEVERILRRAFEDRVRLGHDDLESLEFEIRAAS